MDELEYCYIQKSIQESIARARDLEITEFAAQELDLEVQFLSISVTDPDRFLFPDPDLLQVLIWIRVAPKQTKTM